MIRFRFITMGGTGTGIFPCGPRSLAVCVAGSVLVHLLSVHVVGLAGVYRFGLPAGATETVMVDLASPTLPSVSSKPAVSPPAERPAADAGGGEEAEPEPTNHIQSPPSPPAEPRAAAMVEPPSAPSPAAPTEAPAPAVATAPEADARLRTVDFLGSKREKLTYLISMLGLPVGTAVLESRDEGGEVVIALRVKSTAAVSAVYPVDDYVETRHVGGRFIMTKIRQHEGTFRSSSLFTINSGKKRITFTDLNGGRDVKTTVPSEDVVDTLSGIYLLRRRPLQVGGTEILHVYDSETYGPVPVEIVRREQIVLPNLRKMDTLLVRPLQKTAGLFMHTGDILIWLTDDERKVPVRVATTVPLGRVTADLVSAESDEQDGTLAKADAVSPE